MSSNWFGALSTRSATFPVNIQSRLPSVNSQLLLQSVNSQLQHIPSQLPVHRARPSHDSGRRRPANVTEPSQSTFQLSVVQSTFSARRSRATIRRRRRVSPRPLANILVGSFLQYTCFLSSFNGDTVSNSDDRYMDSRSRALNKGRDLSLSHMPALL